MSSARCELSILGSSKIPLQGSRVETIFQPLPANKDPPAMTIPSNDSDAQGFEDALTKLRDGYDEQLSPCRTISARWLVASTKALRV
jgi:hypothetical protein